MKQEWIKNMHDRMQDYERQAPEGLLSDVQREMARRGAVPVRPARRTAVWPWVRRGVAAAAVVAAVAWLLTGLPLRHDQPAEVAQRPGGSAAPSVPQAADVPAPVQLPAYETAVGTPRQLAAATGGGHPSAAEHIAAALAPSVSDSLPACSEPSVTPVPRQETLPRQTRKQHRDGWYQDAPALLPTARNAAAGPSRLSVGAGYGGVMAGTNGAAQGMLLAAADPYGAYTADMSGRGHNALLFDAEPSRTETHHRQPVRVGVSVGYRITNRWSLRSGVDYSRLSTDITRTNGTESQTTHQRLHYVGVPLSAAYSLWHGGPLHVYVSAGGEVEKLVSGKAETVRSVRGEPRQATSEKVTEGRPQFSATAAAGIEYKATPFLGLYAEPGVSYHFNNGSGVNNLYKDRPTSFSLQVGVRINVK